MRSLVLLAMLASARAVIVTVPGLGDVLGTDIESTWTKRTVHAFYGIRYGLAPSGSRRFAPPVRAEPWDGLYVATSPGRKCPELLKYQNMTDPGEDLEDCLFLNVFTPTISGSADNATLLPVMVYIHGGGFYEGSTTYFPPHYLMEKDIVLVVIQYRLGPLGFLSLETDDIAGNVGFMDQVLALKWVNQNIESFGGDNKQVTVFGQSAGGGSISLLLMSPMVEEGLIHKAIMQSGTSFSNWIIDKQPIVFAKALFRELTNITEEVDTSLLEDRFKTATVQEYYYAIQSLLLKNPLQLSKLGRAVIQKTGSVKFLDRFPSDLEREGKIHTIPMMAGNTKHDGSYLVTVLYDSLEAYGLVNDTNYIRNNLTIDLLKLLGYDDVSGAFFDVIENKFFKKLFDEERDLTFRDVAPGLIDIAGMPFFKAPSLKHAKFNSRHNKNTFLYTFDYIGEYTLFGYGEDTSKYPFDGGVSHSNDLLYLFPYHYTEPLNDNDTRIAKMMVDFWTSFAINGEPSSPGSDTWEPLKTGRNGPYYHINTTGYMDQDFVENEYSAATNDIIT